MEDAIPIFFNFYFICIDVRVSGTLEIKFQAVVSGELVLEIESRSVWKSRECS